MSFQIEFYAKCFSGFGGLSDGKCFPCSGSSLRLVNNISPCPSRAKFGKANVLCLEPTLRSSSFACSATSSSINPRKNPQYSKYKKQGTSRSNKKRQSGVGDDYENLEESDILSSKTSKAPTTVTLRPRERKILELFRKVQAQLREREVAVKGEKKVERLESSKGKVGIEGETVDSLLKLLRKHSVQKEKKTGNSSDFIQDPSGPTDLSHEKQENEAIVLDRPKSDFRRRSPVSRVKTQPSYSSEEATLNTVASAAIDEKGNKISLDEDVFDEIAEDDETSDIHDDHDNDDDDEVGGKKIEEMALPELKKLAKSRGVKRYSKLKKAELIELLQKM
ncbi:unnamed protein product [Cuscuta epithymum]|uniref:Rho termination factor-like N-terminal domain-containing protein n=1 Tax=Cuscuta epithymum TaxID=186058 RepID=A0AAV0CEP7_9ASTE|nr:unnamed protein product [Cuscuta epithymum]CAH9132831.1 unnamed protein product [Cuscuta epithymum]